MYHLFITQIGSCYYKLRYCYCFATITTSVIAFMDAYCRMFCFWLCAWPSVVKIRSAYYTAYYHLPGGVNRVIALETVPCILLLW